ncbi:MAG TPA: HIRAN domain-containing protein [Thermoanaerobaculia bacterium]
MSKRQRVTLEGAQLLSLCQSVTEDGSLADEEIVALKEWLIENRSADLPSISFLTTTVEKILADGTVTKEERDGLYRAIETVLLPELRRGAMSKRRAVQEEERSKRRQKRVAEEEREREERQRNRPLGSWNFMVAGVRHEGRPALIQRFVSEDDDAFLARDRGNQFSRNAVEIRTRGGIQVGYVPEDYALEIAPLLDQGYRHEAFFTKVLTGGRSPIPVVQAYVYRPDATVKEAVLPAEVPPKASPAMMTVINAEGRELEAQANPATGVRERSGCASMLVAVGLLTAEAFLLWTLAG